MAGLVLAAHLVCLAMLGTRIPGPQLSNALQIIAAAAAVITFLLTAAFSEGPFRRIWRLFALAFALWGIANGVYLLSEMGTGFSPGTLALMDGMFVGFYVPLAAALFPATSAKRGKVEWVQVLDFAQVCVLFTTIYLYFFFFRRFLGGQQLLFLGDGPLQAWDLLNVVLLTLFLLRSASAATPEMRRLYRFGAFILALYAVGDTLFSWARTYWASKTGDWYDLAYTLPFAIAMGVAATWTGMSVKVPAPEERLPFHPIGNLLPLITPIVTLMIAGHVAGEFIGMGLAIATISSGLFAARLAVTQNRQNMALAMFRSSEARYRDVVENASDIIFTVDLNGKLTSLNQAGAALSARPLGDLLGRNITDFLSQDAPRVLQQFQSALKGDPGQPFRATIYTVDGRQIPMEISVRALRTPTGEPMGIQAIARDITVRARDEEILRSSEEKFFKAFQSHPNPMVISRVSDGHVIEVNVSYEKFFGYARAEVLGRTANELNLYVRPADREQMMRIMLANGILTDHEMQFRTRTGEVRTVLASADLIEIAREKCILGVLRDVTEQRRAERALRISEQRFVKAFDASPIPMLIISLPDLRYAEVNDSLVRTLGLAREKLLGRTDEEVGLKVDLARRAAIVKRLQAGSRVENEDYPIRLLSGETRHMLLSADWIEFGSKPHVLVAAVDVSESRRLEDHFRKAFHSNPLAMSISCLDSGRYVDVNDGYSRLLGYTRADVVGRTAMELNVWADPEKRNALVTQLREHGRVENFEIELRTKGGQIRSGVLYAETMELAGTPHLLSAVLDLTELKQLEEQFRQSQKMEAIGRLAGGVAHDFNNLLMVIIGRCDVALTKLTGKNPATASVEEAQRAAWKAASLTRQLLAFSRKQVLQPQVLNLNTATGNMEKLLVRLIGEDVSLVVRGAADLGQVRADPGGIEQILMNLCVNARDAMPRGGRITIETANVTFDEAYVMRHGVVAPGRYTMLAVSDTGAGMDATTQSRIFEPFFTTKEAGKGTGLGLSTVYGIVKQSDGYIWVYSELGHGTTFKIYLPRLDAPVEETVEETAAPAVSRGAETILLVEDEEQVRELATEFLRGAGYRVLNARNGNEALAVCATEPAGIQLVLTDIIMPGMNGRELVEQLHARYAPMKVIYLSGYTDEAVTGHGILPHGHAFLQKPFRLSDLAHKVREVLDA
jgi:PAS domain S-box-containing protein